MSDSIPVTSHHSYGSRVGNSFKSILGGIILVIISIVLLFRNENNYVKQKAALKEGASIVNETTADQINPDFEGKEVYLHGETASNDETLVDETFGVKTDNLKLKRTVEMYQWYEESDESCSDNLGGSEDCTTTYNYHKKWSNSAIDSSNFYSSNGHENPTTREYNSTEKEKSPITLGTYTLSNIFISQLDNYSTINLNEEDITIPENYINNNENFHIYDNYIYIGKNPNEPAIGDFKITFSDVKTGTVSIIGKQLGNELTSYTVSNGRSISLLEQGNVSAEDMFLHAQQANKSMTWILRLIGLILMYCGFAAMFKFIETLAKIIPFISKIIGAGTGIIALGLTLIVGFITIGIARLAVRPIIGISCLIVAIIGIFLLKKPNKNKTIEEKPEIIDIKE